MKKRGCVLLVAFCLAGSVLAGDMLQAAGYEFIDATGGKTTIVPSAKIVGFYFSAHWCPPCRAFTPKLVEFYCDLKKEFKDIEIVFVSSDKGEAEMMTYMTEATMPWLAVPYGSAAANALKKIKKEELESNGIPLLVIVRDGQMITKNGREDVQSLGLKAYQKWLNAGDAPEEKAAEKTEEKGVEKAAEKRQSASSQSAIPAPEKKEMTLYDLQAQRRDLDGKVIKTTMNRIYSFEQTAAGTYQAHCGFWNAQVSTWGVYVTFPKEGKEFVEAMHKERGGFRTVYLRVRGNNIEAVGERYRKDKNEYSW